MVATLLQSCLLPSLHPPVARVRHSGSKRSRPSLTTEQDHRETSPSALCVPALSACRYGSGAVGRSKIRTLSRSRAVASHTADYAVGAFREARASSHVIADSRGPRLRRARTTGALSERSVPDVGHAAPCLCVAPS
jgi:hypothetical protein